MPGHRSWFDVSTSVSVSRRRPCLSPRGSGHRNITTINWSWTDKIEPRLGAAWGSANGKLKIFGSYGVTNDVMKLLLGSDLVRRAGMGELQLSAWSRRNGTFTVKTSL